MTDRLERELLGDPADELDRDVGGTGDREAQRREVVRVAVGEVEDRLVDGRRAGEHGDPLALDDVAAPSATSNTASGKIVAPRISDARQPGLVAEDVEERVDDQVAVALAQAGPVAPVEVGPQRLAVGHDDTLGVARRAGREDDVAGVVGADARRPGRRGGVAHGVAPGRGSRPSPPRRARPRAIPRSRSCGRAQAGRRPPRRGAPDSRCRGSPAR